jgi:hypothetical protein
MQNVNSPAVIENAIATLPTAALTVPMQPVPAGPSSGGKFLDAEIIAIYW